MERYITLKNIIKYLNDGIGFGEFVGNIFGVCCGDSKKEDRGLRISDDGKWIYLKLRTETEEPQYIYSEDKIFAMTRSKMYKLRISIVKNYSYIQISNRDITTTVEYETTNGVCKISLGSYFDSKSGHITDGNERMISDKEYELELSKLPVELSITVKDIFEDPYTYFDKYSICEECEWTWMKG